MQIPLTLLLCLGSLTGCGGNTPAPTSSPDSANHTSGPAEQPSTESPAAAASTDGTEHARDEVWVDDQGRKWLGKVPFDVFFDEPYSVASNQTPVGGSPAAPADAGSTAIAGNPSVPSGDSVAGSSEPAAPAEAAAGTDKPEQPTASPDATGGWGELITAEALDEEVKSIRNFLNENLQSVGAYNSAMLMLPQKAAVLAALAEVASKHPDAVSWKDDAAYIRDLAKQMNASPLQRGAKDQKRMLELYESASDTLNRSRPAGLSEPPAGDSFAESAEMRLIMMRMEEAEKRLRTEAGTEAGLNSRKDMVSHEAAIMGVLAKVVTDPGYGYADDNEFTGYSKEIIDAAQVIRSAAGNGDFAGYEAALSKIATTCQNCHSKYKND